MMWGIPTSNLVAPDNKSNHKERSEQPKLGDYSISDLYSSKVY